MFIVITLQTGGSSCPKYNFYKPTNLDLGDFSTKNRSQAGAFFDFRPMLSLFLIPTLHYASYVGTYSYTANYLVPIIVFVRRFYSIWFATFGRT